MATRGQFNTKSPTVKRIQATELASQPSADYYAEPLDSNLFEWHFTLRGPPAPSPYAEGIYHGRIILPSQYPLRPPSFRFLTPTGRFEVNREICLSISDHHEESWQPAWGIRTALVAMRSFMVTDAGGQLGGLECGKEVRERMAKEGAGWKCSVCAKTNAEILKEREDLVKESEGEQQEETVPEELRLAYRSDLGVKKDEVKPDKGKGKAVDASSTAQAPVATPELGAVAASSAGTAPVTRPVPTRTSPAPIVHQLPRQIPDRSLAWIDTCIYGVVAALLVMVLRKLYL
ncbi:unnamed protein product [Periconia digitata]|uniref:UBC core domain-containing protein n=1 Tax=Periconia digitata TaxID=1303443 RepID=A0A9W4UAH3_9PLEO|nr:unnamed protein product [Periconia digitata]